ncbi:unnamed protein product [Rotaria sp. Silwood2]|nr:unnamed protein product [Rotaria sp. Silwood2]
MSDGDGDQGNSKTLKITLSPTKLTSDIAKEKTQQQQNQLLIQQNQLLIQQNQLIIIEKEKEAKLAIIEKEKEAKLAIIDKEKEAKLAIIDKEKEAKEKEKEAKLAIIEKEKELLVEQNSKRMKLAHGPPSSSSFIEEQSRAISERGFFNTYAKHIKSFEINSLLHDNNHFNDNDDLDDQLKNCIEDYHRLTSSSNMLEANIQNAFDKLIVSLLSILNKDTSLKYLPTYKKKYLEGRAPDCTFIYKNVNIVIDGQCKCLQDVAVCLGEIKSSSTFITDAESIGQLLLNLTILLRNQTRERIYGFLINIKYIRFYYVEKKPYSDLYDFYQSESFKLFNDLSETSSSSSSSSVNMKTTSEQSKTSYINEHTWKIFLKFLTMKTEFYQYTALNINPNDYLYDDKYSIQRKLGGGLTSMVYLLKKNNNNYSKIGPSHPVIKISKGNKFIIFSKQLEPLESLTLTHSQQLIDIIQHLYDSFILHRDLRPENLMYDKSHQHLKLIDFGFATIYQKNEMTKRLPIEGTITYAGQKFLEHYLKFSFESSFERLYDYEQTFDLQCALNVIMYMTNSKIKNEINSMKQFLDTKEKALASLEYWEKLKKNDRNYFDLLELINKSKFDDFARLKSADFNDIRTAMKELFPKEQK